MPSFELSRWLFLKLLGTVYLVAFASLAPQILGLVGSDGLLPAAEYLDRARDFYGGQAYVLLPTLGWVGAGDGALLALCWGGVVLSVLAIGGVAPVPTFALLWAGYLSLTVLGQTFLSFQWDVLLLETGLLAVFYAPVGWRPAPGTETRALAGMRWLLWVLLFKLMFLSGITKLVSGDETWWGLTALSYHYQTQPLPTWTSWYAHHLPPWVQTTSVAVMFAIELVVPFFVFAPVRLRRTRALACVVLVLFQLAIAATGNYGFFNLLTVVLCLSLLDDAHVARLVPRGISDRFGNWTPTAPPVAWRGVVGVLAAAVGLLTAITIWHGSTYTRSHPRWSETLLALARPIRSINTYGLFRTMTTERPEIIVEGSRDGITWSEYEFRWKPGDVSRRPRFVQPHMPRLDWQLWFAALDPAGAQHWLRPLVDGLLVGSPRILEFLDPAGNPFGDAPPRYIRLMRYRYVFTTPEAAGETGAWWDRGLLGPLTPPLSAP